MRLDGGKAVLTKNASVPPSHSDGYRNVKRTTPCLLYKPEESSVCGHAMGTLEVGCICNLICCFQRAINAVHSSSTAPHAYLVHIPSSQPLPLEAVYADCCNEHGLTDLMAVRSFAVALNTRSCSRLKPRSFLARSLSEPTIQGCSSACFAVILFRGSTTSSLRTKSYRQYKKKVIGSQVLKSESRS